MLDKVMNKGVQYQIYFERNFQYRTLKNKEIFVFLTLKNATVATIQVNNV